MENLRETVYDAQKGDKNALLEVITFFDPLIKKYFKTKIVHKLIRCVSVERM